MEVIEFHTFSSEASEETGGLSDVALVAILAVPIVAAAVTLIVG